MGYIWDLLKNGKDKKNDNYSPKGDPTNYHIENGDIVYKEPESNPLISKGGNSALFTETITIETNESGLSYNNHENDTIVYNIDDVDKKELSEELTKVTLERNKLKHEVEYLDNYIKYLEDNFHFVLKDCKLAKQLFGFKPL